MTTETSTLALSDSEFAKLSIPTVTELETTETKVEEKVEENTTETSTKEEVATEEEPKESTEITSEETSEKVETTETKEQTTSEIDYKKVYEEVFKPFKANGKEMTVDSVDDIRQLMQMGANYNKKMAALKPNLKVIKMLENNGLLDEAKLNYLIDLDKKNPEAIKKLIKDSGIDPLEVDINAEIGYKANTYTVNDKEVELDAVLSEIRDSDSFNITVDIIGNKWDDESKRVLLEHPSVIKIINEHVGNGIYKTITNEVERLRVLGKLEGLSDIDAYKAVGDAMYAQRANVPKNNTNTNIPANKVTNKEDPRIVEKRKAASPTKSVVSNTKQNFNPLAMSDEEFLKIASSKYI